MFDTLEKKPNRTFALRRDRGGKILSDTKHAENCVGNHSISQANTSLRREKGWIGRWAKGHPFQKRRAESPQNARPGCGADKEKDEQKNP